jgi:hypothetical protein
MNMRNSKILKSLLIIAGLIASLIGAEIFVSPAIFYATYGIDLGGDTGLLNEKRASGGGLLVSGLLIISGAFVAKLSFTAVLVSTLLYLSYGMSRVMSMVIDGVPVEGLVQAAIIEILIGLACMVALVVYREKGKRYPQ